MDDLGYYDDISLAPLLEPAVDPVINLDPYTPSYFVPAGPDPSYQDLTGVPFDTTVDVSPVFLSYDSGIDPAYQGVAVAVVPVDSVVAITPVAIGYDPGPAFLFSDAPAIAVYTPVYVDTFVPIIPSVVNNSYVLDGTQGSIPPTVLDFRPGDQVTLLGYEDGFDNWGFLATGGSGGNCSCPTVVGSLDGGNASFAVTLSGFSLFDSLSISPGVNPDGTGYLQIVS